jgi:hypothetical protein
MQFYFSILGSRYPCSSARSPSFPRYNNDYDQVDSFTRIIRCDQSNGDPECGWGVRDITATVLLFPSNLMAPCDNRRPRSGDPTCESSVGAAVSDPRSVQVGLVSASSVSKTSDKVASSGANRSKTNSQCGSAKV